MRAQGLAVPGDAAIALSPEFRGQTIPAMGITVKVPCRRCNNGWMAQLEADVKPAVERLMSAGSNVVALSSDETNLLRRWAVKTAAMFEFNHPPTRTFGQDVLLGIKDASHDLPGVWSIGLLRNLDPTNYFRISHVGGTYLAGRQEEGQLVGVGEPGGVSATLFAAHEVVFVVRFASGTFGEKMIRATMVAPEPIELDPQAPPEWPVPEITNAQWDRATTLDPSFRL